MTCMLKHVSKPYDEFYFIEKLLFPMFYERKNIKLHHSNFILERANFRVLHTGWKKIENPSRPRSVVSVEDINKRSEKYITEMKKRFLG